jgi:hypothetical protein
MTFAHYDFAAGSSIHEHFHAEEEVHNGIEGNPRLRSMAHAKPGQVTNFGWLLLCLGIAFTGF